MSYSEPTSRSGGTQQERVIFLHMPKAAGSTLNQVIARQYPEGSVLAIESGRQEAALEEFKRLPWAARESIRLLRGHIGFGLHAYLPPPVIYITILRDPVDRVLSHYYYLRAQLERGSTFSDRPWLRDAARMSLADYVRHGRSADVRNGQTKLLAGQMHGWGADDAMLPTDDLLETARRNLLDGIAVVGLRERFDETLVLLKRRLGWRTPFYVSRNVTRGRPLKEQIPNQALEIIRDENALDIQLYDDALRVFSQALRDEGPGFRREVGRLRFLNRRWDEARQVRTSAGYRADILLRRMRHG